jgi:hypothetical protein
MIRHPTSSDATKNEETAMKHGQELMDDLTAWEGSRKMVHRPSLARILEDLDERLTALEESSGRVTSEALDQMDKARKPLSEEGTGGWTPGSRWYTQRHVDALESERDYLIELNDQYVETDLALKAQITSLETRLKRTQKDNQDLRGGTITLDKTIKPLRSRLEEAEELLRDVLAVPDPPHRVGIRAFLQDKP